jgi:hypothetical protein
MKYLFTGIAAIAAIVLSAAVGAQPTNSSGGNAVGLPGPNPGGPGLTPYSTGASPAPTPSGQMPAGGRRTSGERIPAIMPDTSSPPPSASNTTSATPPSHRHARHYAHHVPSHHPSRFPNLQGNTVANQLNQTELSRLQSGNFTPPSPPEMTSSETGATPTNRSGANRMSTGGRATSTRYGQ